QHFRPFYPSSVRDDLLLQKLKLLEAAMHVPDGVERSGHFWDIEPRPAIGRAARGTGEATEPTPGLPCRIRCQLVARPQARMARKISVLAATSRLKAARECTAQVTVTAMAAACGAVSSRLRLPRKRMAMATKPTATSRIGIDPATMPSSLHRAR